MSEEPRLMRSIFDTESEDSVKSPEKLDEYVRVSTPGAWILALALCLLVAALVFWGFYGWIPVNLELKGVGISEADLQTVVTTEQIEVRRVICLVDPTDITSIQLDNKRAMVRFRDGQRITAVSYLLDTSLLADDEISQLLDKYQVNSSWILSQLGEGEYRYVVAVDLDQPLEYLYWGDTCDVSITIREARPISLMFN